MFLKLFEDIFSGKSPSIVKIYNEGVIQLKIGNTRKAIDIFEKIKNKHPSAAYNLALIYLHGDDGLLPDYSLARKYFQLADQQNHPKARKSAYVINLDGEKKITAEEYLLKLSISIQQFISVGQIGNLSYIIANDVFYNIIGTSTDKIFSSIRFFDYEVWCIQNYASQKIMRLYEKSELNNYIPCYSSDWEDGKVAVISEYVNDIIMKIIFPVSNGALDIFGFEVGAMRLAMLNYVCKYCKNNYSILNAILKYN